VTFGKLLPPRVPVVGAPELRRVTERLAADRPGGLLDELQAQNRELLASLDQLRRRQEELERLNRELEDTNRGVVALYAELDERADHLRRADEMKSRFLSNMSHEFRTPLNSMLALTQLLCDRVDGDLTPEQETQVLLIRKAAQDLSELVNDLLDLAKVEAGKIVVRPAEFEVDATCSERSAACCARCSSPTPCGSCSTTRWTCRRSTPTRPRCRRFCATSSRTR
jgi:signal transduction histidine kinase